MKTLSNEYKEILQKKYDSVINTLFTPSEIIKLNDILKSNIKITEEILAYPEDSSKIECIKVNDFEYVDELNDAFEEYKQLLASGR